MVLVLVYGMSSFSHRVLRILQHIAD
jgi:hypothetical protein